MATWHFSISYYTKAANLYTPVPFVHFTKWKIMKRFTQMQQICRDKKTRAFKEVHLIAKTTLPSNIKMEGDMRTWIIDCVSWGCASLGLVQYLNSRKKYNSVCIHGPRALLLLHCIKSAVQFIDSCYTILGEWWRLWQQRQVK